MKKITSAVICALAVSANSSHAVPITYDNEALFTSAIGGSADVTVDFNSYNSDQSFRNSSFDAGPFTLSSQGNNQNNNTQNTVDATPYAFGNFANINNSTFAHFFITANDGGTTASLTFDNPVSAFGATFKELNEQTDITLVTSAGVEVLDQNIGEGIGFFGFTLDAGVFLESLTFSRTSVGDGFGMDDVMLSTPSVDAPEPGSLALLGLGLAGLGFSRRKK